MIEWLDRVTDLDWLDGVDGLADRIDNLNGDGFDRLDTIDTWIDKITGGETRGDDRSIRTEVVASQEYDDSGNPVRPKDRAPKVLDFSKKK